MNEGMLMGTIVSWLFTERAQKAIFVFINEQLAITPHCIHISLWNFYTLEM